MSINSGDRPWPQTLGHEDLDWPASEQRVLVPFHEGINLTETGVLGASITFGSDGELYLLYAMEPEDLDALDLTRLQAELKMEVRDEFDVPVVDAVESYTPGLLDSFVQSFSITTTVVDAQERRFFGRGRDERTVADGCHTVVGTGMDTFESPASVLVPVASGPHSGLATRVAEAIAKSYDCWIDLFHVVPTDAPEETKANADRLLDAYEYRLDDAVDVGHIVHEAPDPADAIIDHSEYYNLTVLGAPEKGKLRRFLFGSTTDEVTENVTHGPVLTAHRNVEQSALSRWL